MKQGFWIIAKQIVRNADVVLEVLDARSLSEQASNVL